MNSDLQFEWAQADELAEIRSFVTAGFGPDSFQAHPERIQWLYFSNPHGVHITTCRRGGKLVAVCPHVVQDVSLAGHKIEAAFGVDFYVDAAWRRQGIASRFLELRRDRFALSLSTGQSPAMQALYVKLGARDLGPIRIGYGRRRPPGPAAPRKFVRGFLSWWKHIAAPKPQLGLRGHETLDQDQRAMLSRWQEWRYGKLAPYQDHHYFVDSDSQAIAIAREADNALHLLGMVPGRAGRAEVLRSVIRASATDEVQIRFYGQELARDCAQAGFLLRTQTAHLVAMTADAEIDKLLTPGCIDLMAEASDSDLMRQPSL